MSTLTIVANILANEDKIELVKAELLKLIDITRSEAVLTTTYIKTTKIQLTSLFMKIGKLVHCGKHIWLTNT